MRPIPLPASSLFAPPLAQSLRGDASMLEAHVEQRCEPRSFVMMPVTFKFASGRYVGMIRDWSAHGMFFYSRFRPVVGSNLYLMMILPKTAATATSFAVRGKVVRVEQRVAGAAVGVAMSIAECQVLQ